DVEGLFEGHDQFDGIQRIGAQVVDKRRAGRDFALINSQLLDNNLFYLLVYGCHVSPRLTKLDLNSVTQSQSRICAGSEPSPRGLCMSRSAHLRTATKRKKASV